MGQPRPRWNLRVSRNQPGEGAAPGLYHLVHRATGPRMGECTGKQGLDVLREPSPSWASERECRAERS